SNPICGREAEAEVPVKTSQRNAVQSTAVRMAIRSMGVLLAASHLKDRSKYPYVMISGCYHFGFFLQRKSISYKSVGIHRNVMEGRCSGA
ncbi:MAG: hypothetical protein ACLFNV_09610, partial [Desulfovibrionales bacterium]